MDDEDAVRRGRVGGEVEIVASAAGASEGIGDGGGVGDQPAVAGGVGGGGAVEADVPSAGDQGSNAEDVLGPAGEVGVLLVMNF